MFKTRNKILELISNGITSSTNDAIEFRAFYEFNILNGQEQIIKIVVPSDIYLNDLVINLDNGALRYEAINAPIESGIFAEIGTVFNTNNRTDAKVKANQVKAYTGGSITGGVVADLALIRTGTNNQRQSVVESTQSARGIAAGDYYVKLLNVGNGDINGVFYANWTES